MRDGAGVSQRLPDNGGKEGAVAEDGLSALSPTTFLFVRLTCA
jgi:hypothetical protein